MLILFLPQEWEIYHRRPYWEALAKHTKVLVIEPPSGLLTFWLHPKRMAEYFRGGGKVRQNGENLFFLRPLLIVPPGIDFRFPVFASIDRALIKRQVLKAVKTMHQEKSGIMPFLVHVQQSLFSKLIPNSTQCYEITDLYTLAIGQDKLDINNRYTKRALKEEKRIVRDSDMIITSSKLIYESLCDLHSNVYYLRNSADYRHFSKSTDTTLEIPQKAASLPSPRLGFIGYINNLIDFELLLLLADEFNDGSIVMIGAEQRSTGITDDISFQKTKQKKNIHYLGFKNYESLPAYLKSFDVCLMPFRLNEWMQHSAPNKTYQYLASGKPIVSTDFPEVRFHNNVIRIGKDHGNFVRQVREALGEKSDTLAAERKKIAQENSTENRAVKVIELIKKTISRAK
ncbi:MAG TPA: glycosyltransferase [candidate division Zixibacteria bacterium]|nr:glycosyltransferase [candidate division Zixibacteria bacterium]